MAGLLEQFMQCTCDVNIVARSLNHCCSGKATMSATCIVGTHVIANILKIFMANLCRRQR